MIQIQISATPELLAVLSALGGNMETVALAIDSAMRIQQHMTNPIIPASDITPPTEVPAPVQQAPVQYPQPQYQQASPPVVPFPQQQQIAPVAAPVAPPPAYTMEMLGVAGASLVDAGRQTELIGLLGRFGVPSIMGLPKEAYGTFALELRQLGARI